jgi:hypothetical protein
MTEAERDFTEMAEAIGLKDVVVSFSGGQLVISYVDPRQRSEQTLIKRLYAEMGLKGYDGGITTRQCAPDFTSEFIISEDGE